MRNVRSLKSGLEYSFVLAPKPSRRGGLVRVHTCVVGPCCWMTCCSHWYIKRRSCILCFYCSKWCRVDWYSAVRRWTWYKWWPISLFCATQFIEYLRFGREEKMEDGSLLNRESCCWGDWFTQFSPTSVSAAAGVCYWNGNRSASVCHPMRRNRTKKALRFALRKILTLLTNLKRCCELLCSSIHTPHTSSKNSFTFFLNLAALLVTYNLGTELEVYT